MNEENLQIFIDAIIRYFGYTTDKDVVVGTPYLEENRSPMALDYTGIIGVAGPIKGCVYVTAPRILLTHLLLSSGESDTSEENIIDLIGELANTISGNARRELGKDFMISVPLVIEGAPSHIHLPQEQRSYVIPLSWKSYQAAVVISLSERTFLAL
jgi:chemotaxis protein CheX